jgi:hypothetical protein
VQLYFAILVANLFYFLFFPPLFIVFSVTKRCINGQSFLVKCFVTGFTMRFVTGFTKQKSKTDVEIHSLTMWRPCMWHFLIGTSSILSLCINCSLLRLPRCNKSRGMYTLHSTGMRNQGRNAGFHVERTLPGIVSFRYLLISVFLFLFSLLSQTTTRYNKQTAYSSLPKKQKKEVLIYIQEVKTPFVLVIS